MVRNPSTLLFFASAFVLLPYVASGQENVDRGELKAVLEQVSLPRINDAGDGSFSVRLTVGSGTVDDKLSTVIHVGKEDDSTRVTIFASDGIPHAMIADGMLVRVTKDDSLRIFKDCGFLVAVDGGDAAEGILRFGVQPELHGRSHVDIRIDQLLGTMLERANSVSYDDTKLRGVIRLKGREVIVQLRKNPDGSLALGDITVRESGKLVIRISDVKTEADGAMVRGERFAALWEASGGRVLTLAPREMRPDDLLPAHPPHRVAEADQRIDRVMSLIGNWPRSSPMLDLVRPDNHEIPADVIAKRQQVRDIILSKTIYAKLPQLASHLASDDVVVRTDVMVALRTATPPEFRNRDLLEDMLLRGLLDESDVVRQVALAALATHAHTGTMRGEHFFVHLAKLVEQPQSPRDFAMTAYCIARFSNGVIELGNYPRSDSGWPRVSADNAIAWWLIHEEQLRAKMFAWLSKQRKAAHAE